MSQFRKHIARWAETPRTDGAFAKCHEAPEIIFLSHCVPNPPDKGEKIRAYHELNALAKRFRVHLVCFARTPQELTQAMELTSCCASIYAELLSSRPALMRAAVRFGLGGSLTAAFYRSRSMMRQVASLGDRVLATVAYSSAMAQYASERIPLVLDLIDVDSEKYLDFARMRRFGFIYRLEANRLRSLEARFVRRSVNTFVVTGQEQSVLGGFVPERAAECLENGVDVDYYDPAACAVLPELEGRKFVVFVGAMDYYPNADAVCWFAREVFPALRNHVPGLEFLIVGRNPAPLVARLARQAGVSVIGAVPDVRPYLAASVAMVAPLRIARGVQNKVLEALAMGKRAFVSSAVARCFGDELPQGAVLCRSELEFQEALTTACSMPSVDDARIREAARRRFSWQHMSMLCDRIDSLIKPRVNEAVMERA
jgi:sugar transferase (PEP-CTERM/EpsH1 system associated)